MEWLKFLGISFGWLSTLFIAFRWGKYIGLIENQMQIEEATCIPPAKKFEDCKERVPNLYTGEGDLEIPISEEQIKLILYRGQISDVICNYLNRQTGMCEKCKERILPCRYYPQNQTEKQMGLKKFLKKLFSLK